jgi:DNA-directed RNA polymerase subunit alpha
MITCIETIQKNKKSNYSNFRIEPLEIGQGITLGNSLRRTLLSDLTSFAITGARINNIKHEFASISGLREDVLEILLNLKEINFKHSFIGNAQTNLEKTTGFISVKGPLVVTAGMFHLPQNVLKIINPHQYITTITDNSEFYLEIDLEKGKGYQLRNAARHKTDKVILTSAEPATLPVDALFMPVKRVNYKIKLIHDSFGNIKESLNIEIWSNGTLTPKRSLAEAIKLLLDLFYPLLITPEFLALSSEIVKFSLKN